MLDNVNLDMELSRLKYHVEILSDVVADLADFSAYPLYKVALEMGWDEIDTVDARNIFEDFQRKIDTGQNPIDWDRLPIRLKSRFGIDRHGFRRVILTFHDSGCYPEVCLGYTKSLNFLPSELKSIVYESWQVSQFPAQPKRLLPADTPGDRSGRPPQ